MSAFHNMQYWNVTPSGVLFRADLVWIQMIDITFSVPALLAMNQFFSAGQTGEMERDLRVAIVVIPKSLNIFAVAKNTLKEATYKIARSLTTSK